MQRPVGPPPQREVRLEFRSNHPGDVILQTRDHRGRWIQHGTLRSGTRATVNSRIGQDWRVINRRGVVVLQYTTRNRPETIVIR